MHIYHCTIYTYKSEGIFYIIYRKNLPISTINLFRKAMKKQFIYILLLFLIGCSQKPIPENMYKVIASYVELQEWQKLYNSLDSYSKGFIDSQITLLSTVEPSKMEENNFLEDQMNPHTKKLLIAKIAKIPEIQQHLKLNFNSQNKIIRVNKAKDNITITIKNSLNIYEKIVFKYEKNAWKLHLNIQSNVWQKHLEQLVRKLGNQDQKKQKKVAKITKEKKSSKEIPPPSYAWSGSRPLPLAYKTPQLNIKNKEKKTVHINIEKPKEKSKLKAKKRITLAELYSLIRTNPEKIRWLILKGTPPHRVLSGTMNDGYKFKFNFPEDQDLLEVIRSKVKDFTILDDSLAKNQEESSLQELKNTLPNTQEKDKKYKNVQLKTVLISLKFKNPDWQKEQYLNTMNIEVFFVNKNDADIKAFEGDLIIYHILGEKLYSFPIKYTKGIAAQTKVYWQKQVEYNKFDNMIIQLRKIPPHMLKVKLAIKGIVFHK